MKSAKSFFLTLAYQLSYRYPALAERINAVVDEDPELTGRNPVKQFDRLIAQAMREPLEAMPILLVIDALDECEEHDARTILSLFMQQAPQIPRLRVFITTRPEPHIAAVLERYHDHEQFHLHDIDKFTVEADIQSYLEFRLSSEQVQHALPHLRPSTFGLAADQGADGRACWDVRKALYHCSYGCWFHSRPPSSKPIKSVSNPT
jgi:hypothetical protein